jgi:hypothetical protein
VFDAVRKQCIGSGSGCDRTDDHSDGIERWRRDRVATGSREIIQSILGQRRCGISAAGGSRTFILPMPEQRRRAIGRQSMRKVGYICDVYHSRTQSSKGYASVTHLIRIISPNRFATICINERSRGSFTVTQRIITQPFVSPETTKFLVLFVKKNYPTRSGKKHRDTVTKKP